MDPSFARLLRQCRFASGLTQEELAERAGLSARSVSDLERGLKQAPRSSTVRRLAQALDLNRLDAERLREAAVRRGIAAQAGDGQQQHHNLPRELTSFIGRGRELRELRPLLSTARLVTLTGAGGVGKTRLAREVAGSVADTYPDGVWLVDLAALADPMLVPQAVASALGVREQPGRPLRETLADVLRPRRALLVLDNCEHLVVACAELADALLRACADLRILATSRELLHVAGETAWRVPPLELPPLPTVSPITTSQLEEVERSEAVRLFTARAAAALPGFALTNADLLTVAHMCHRLDGLPLAIELAAARVGTLGLEQLAARLADRFRLLTGGSRTALPRQQTLRATLEWSYALLAEPEQRLFERLTVFAGGWTLEAAEAVCAGDGIEPADVLELLAQLVDKSLVVVNERLVGEARYGLLETLREYGFDCLVNSGGIEAAQRRHAAFYLELAERAARELTGAEQRRWLSRLEREHENLRGALRWTIEHEEAEVGLQLAGALWRFWWIHGHLSEGRRWLDVLLLPARSGGAGLAAARAKALSSAGVLANDLGDYSQAAALLEESLAMFRDLGDEHGTGFALNNLGLTATYQGDYGRATVLFEESLALLRDLGDKGGSAWAFNNLANVARVQGDYGRAGSLSGQSLALFREQGDMRGSAWALNHMGLIATYRGDYGPATALLEESLGLLEDLGDKGGAAWSLNHLGLTAAYQGDYDRAAAVLEESLALLEDLGDKGGAAWSLNHLGLTAALQQDYARATALSEESLALCRDLGDKGGSVWALSNLGRVAADQGEYRRATMLLEESLALARDLGVKPDMARALEELAAVACAQDQPERTARLFGAAHALREAIGAPLPPPDHARYAASLAAARVRLGENIFAAMWEEGRASPADGAVANALRLLS